MTSKERAQWRAKANSLEPIIQLGKEGISDNLLTQIDDALDARELIKIRVHLESAPENPKKLAGELAQPLDAEIIQVIGGIIVLYRKADKQKIAEKKKNRALPSKKNVKKKVKIKGMRTRQKEKEAKNPYVVYDKTKRGNKR